MLLAHTDDIESRSCQSGDALNSLNTMLDLRHPASLRHEFAIATLTASNQVENTSVRFSILNAKARLSRVEHFLQDKVLFGEFGNMKVFDSLARH